jgi:hypothetical protein
MTGQPSLHQWLATVDVRELHSLNWGIMRLMFRSFAEEIELGRYLRTLLSGSENHLVAIEPHRDSDGRLSTHVFDVFRVDRLESVG